MRFTQTVVLLAALASAGCGEYEMEKPTGRSAAPEAVGVVVDPFSPAPPASASAQEASAPAPATPTGAEPNAGAAAMPQTGAVPLPPPAEGVVREKADVGAGRKGHYAPGFITTPVSTFWRTQEMAAYRIQVPQALNLYKATNGHFPKTQEEFEREILQPNGIKLPELRANHRYVYDPEKGELLVERPQ